MGKRPSGDVCGFSHSIMDQMVTQTESQFDLFSFSDEQIMRHLYFGRTIDLRS